MKQDRISSSIKVRIKNQQQSYCLEIDSLLDI